MTEMLSSSTRYCAILARSSKARISRRPFSQGLRQAQDSQPKVLSPRAKVQRESAEAIQQFAQRRSAANDGPRPSASLSQSLFSPTTVTASGVRITRHVTRESKDAPAVDTNTQSTSRPSNRAFRPRQSSAPAARPRQIRSRRREGTVRDEFSYEDDGMSRERQQAEELSPEEEAAFLKEMGHEEPFQLKIAQGPHLDMAAMMKEYAPKHFGIQEQKTGEYPVLQDGKKRGLLKDIFMALRRNETYTEKDVEQLTKKLGPMMPRA